MVQFAKSLVSWLAATPAAAAGPSVLSCSETSIALAAGGSPLTVGEIFIRVDTDSSLCREDCGVLFREIVRDDGNGVYQTKPASFSQVFPEGTFDDSYLSTPVESVLPSCHEFEGEELTEVQMAHRSLFLGLGGLFGGGDEPEAAPPVDTPAAAPLIDPATVEALIARKDSRDDDKHLDDDEYYQEDKSACQEFWDATKLFIFEMYCIVRALDCTEYNPGADDDAHYDDDYSGSKSKDSGDDDWRRKLTSTRRMRGARRSLQGATSTTVTFENSQTAKSSDSGEDDHYDDDHYDDDFFDDDDTYTDDGGNFWKILDAVFAYVQSILCLFGKCKEEVADDDGYDDDYSGSKSKDDGKHVRSLRMELERPAVQQYTTSFEKYMTLEEDGINCSFTKCSTGSVEHCFERQHVVADSCQNSMEEWFAMPPVRGEDTVLSWGMDDACRGQDFCYASNVFGQTLCDQQFYASLMQACPNASEVTLSSASPLVTDDLYENCPLVSILLYSQMQLKSDDVYDVVQENQKLHEASGCH